MVVNLPRTKVLTGSIGWEKDLEKMSKKSERVIDLEILSN